MARPSSAAAERLPDWLSPVLFALTCRVRPLLFRASLPPKCGSADRRNRPSARVRQLSYRSRCRCASASSCQAPDRRPPWRVVPPSYPRSSHMLVRTSMSASVHPAAVNLSNRAATLQSCSLSNSDSLCRTSDRESASRPERSEYISASTVDAAARSLITMRRAAAGSQWPSARVFGSLRIETESPAVISANFRLTETTWDPSAVGHRVEGGM